MESKQNTLIKNCCQENRVNEGPSHTVTRKLSIKGSANKTWIERMLRQASKLVIVDRKKKSHSMVIELVHEDFIYPAVQHLLINSVSHFEGLPNAQEYSDNGSGSMSISDTEENMSLFSQSLTLSTCDTISNRS
jgi:hypothetical protein